MTAVEVNPLSLPSSGLVKMDERKRPASYDNDDSAPPQKRQATSGANGTSKSHADNDIPGRDELEKFQKEAILRQMQEYKREKSTLESRLNDMIERATYHDDHLRTIHAWFSQLLDEVRLSTGKVDRSTFQPFPSTLLCSEPAIFDNFLESRAEAIRTAVIGILSPDPELLPSGSDLKEQIAGLLASEKTQINELEKIRLEKEQLEERLETASMRYMVAEKKLDRAKSTTVAKLERSATSGGRNDFSASGGGNADGTSGKHDLQNGQVDSEAFTQIEVAKKEALAASAKQAVQLEKLATENDKLMAQVTSLTLKLSRLSDNDYAHTDLFKQLKHQHEDVLEKINGLEAVNVELRQEVQKLTEERSSYRIKIETETQAAFSDKDSQLVKAESDLARVRTARDKLHAEVQMRKAAQEQEKASTEQVKQLVSARDDRITALESEVARLSGQLDGQIANEIETSSPEELRIAYSDLDRKYSMLNQELTSMIVAYKKVTGTASQKVNNISEMEEKVTRLLAEKAKADQKYFAAMKAKEAREQEVRTLRNQNAKSSDIVSQLKEAEATNRSAVSVLEKHLAESKEALSSLETKHHAVHKQGSEKEIVIEGLEKQVKELTNSLIAKDDAHSATSSTQRKMEVELEKLKVEVAEKDKRLETLKSKGLGSEMEHHEALRSLVICTVCRKNFKDTTLKLCGHVFCKECVEERLASRMRKCPICNKGFGIGDPMHITL